MVIAVSAVKNCVVTQCIEIIVVFIFCRGQKGGGVVRVVTVCQGGTDFGRHQEVSNKVSIFVFEWFMLEITLNFPYTLRHFLMHHSSTFY